MIHFHFVDSVESTALRLITGLGSSEVQPQLSRFSSEPKQVQELFQYQKQLVSAWKIIVMCYVTFSSCSKARRKKIQAC